MKNIHLFAFPLLISPFRCNTNPLKITTPTAINRCLKPIVLASSTRTHFSFSPLNALLSDHAIFTGYKKNKLKNFTFKCSLPLKITFDFFDKKRSFKQHCRRVSALRGAQSTASNPLAYVLNVMLAFSFKNIPWQARLDQAAPTLFPNYASFQTILKESFNFESFQKNIVEKLIRIYVDDYFCALKENSISGADEEREFLSAWSTKRTEGSNLKSVSKLVLSLAKEWMQRNIRPCYSPAELQKNVATLDASIQQYLALLFSGPLLETRIVLRKIELLYPTGTTSSTSTDEKLHDEILKALSSTEFLIFFKQKNLYEPPSQEDLKEFLEGGYFVKDFSASKDTLQENTLRIQLCLKNLLKFLSLSGEKRNKRNVPPAPPSLQPTVEEDAYPSVIIKKLFDDSCIKDRNNLSFGDVLNQVGKTLCNPVSTMGEESQVVDAWNRGDVCPSEEEVRKLKRILGEVDFVVSAFLTILPGAGVLRVSQFIVGPSLQLLGETMNGGSVSTEQIKNLALNVIQEALAKKTGRLASLASAGIFYGSIGEEVREVVQEYRRDGQLSDDSKLTLGNTAFLILLQATFRAAAKRFKNKTYNSAIEKNLSKSDKDVLENRGAQKNHPPILLPEIAPENGQPDLENTPAQTSPPSISLPEIAIENGQAYIELEMGEPPVTERRMIDPDLIPDLIVVNEKGKKVCVYWNKLSRRWKIFSSNMSASAYKMVKEFAAFPVAPAEAERFLNGQENEIEVLLSDGSKKVITAIELYGEIVPFYRDAKNRPYVFSVHQMFENFKKIAYIDGQWEILETQDNIVREFDGFQNFSISETDYLPFSEEYSESQIDGIFTSNNTYDYYIRLKKGLLPIKLFNSDPKIFSFIKNPKQLFKLRDFRENHALIFLPLDNLDISFDRDNRFIKTLNASDETDISRTGPGVEPSLSIDSNGPIFLGHWGDHYIFLEGKFFKIIPLKNKKQFQFKKKGSPIFELSKKSEYMNPPWKLKQIGEGPIVVAKKASTLLKKYGIQPSPVELKDLEFDAKRNLYVHNPSSSGGHNRPKFFIRTDDHNFYEVSPNVDTLLKKSFFSFNASSNANSIEFFIKPRAGKRPILRIKQSAVGKISKSEIVFEPNDLTSVEENKVSHFKVEKPNKKTKIYEFLLNPKGKKEKLLRKTSTAEIYEFDDEKELKRYPLSKIEGGVSPIDAAVAEVQKFNRFHKKGLAQLAFRQTPEKNSLEAGAIFPKVRGERLSDIFARCLNKELPFEVIEYALFKYESIKVNAQELIDNLHVRAHKADLIQSRALSLDDIVIDFSKKRTKLEISNFEGFNFKKGYKKSENKLEFWSEYHAKVKEIEESPHYKRFREEWGIQPDDSVVLELQACDTGRAKRAPGLPMPRLLSCFGKMGQRDIANIEQTVGAEQTGEASSIPEFKSLTDEENWMVKKILEAEKQSMRTGKRGCNGRVRELTDEEKLVLPEDQRELFLIKEYRKDWARMEDDIHKFYASKKDPAQAGRAVEPSHNANRRRFATRAGALQTVDNASTIMNRLYGRGAAFVRLTPFKYRPEIFQVQMRMKKISGKSLKDWKTALMKGRLRVEEVTKLRDVMARLDQEAVRWAELLIDKGVFHGDLHSENIMLDIETGELNLIDFDNSELLSTSKVLDYQTGALKAEIERFKGEVNTYLDLRITQLALRTGKSRVTFKRLNDRKINALAEFGVTLQNVPDSEILVPDERGISTLNRPPHAGNFIHINNKLIAVKNIFPDGRVIFHNQKSGEAEWKILIHNNEAELIPIRVKPAEIGEPSRSKSSLVFEEGCFPSRARRGVESVFCQLRYNEELLPAEVVDGTAENVERKSLGEGCFANVVELTAEEEEELPSDQRGRYVLKRYLEPIKYELKKSKIEIVSENVEEGPSSSKKAKIEKADEESSGSNSQKMPEGLPDLNNTSSTVGDLTLIEGLLKSVRAHNRIYGEKSAFVRLTRDPKNPDSYEASLRLLKMPGEALDDLLRARKLGELPAAKLEQLRSFVQDHADSEKERWKKLLREAGVLHKDIHHGNLLLDLKNKKIYLIDFDEAECFDPSEFVDFEDNDFYLNAYFDKLKIWVTQPPLAKFTCTQEVVNELSRRKVVFEQIDREKLSSPSDSSIWELADSGKKERKMIQVNGKYVEIRSISSLDGGDIIFAVQPEGDKAFAKLIFQNDERRVVLKED